MQRLVAVSRASVALVNAGKGCQAKRELQLVPTSANFPNTTGYIIPAKTAGDGSFSGTYSVPGKPETYSFQVIVESDKRTKKGKTTLCRTIRSLNASVVTTN